jgi:hypothetical protein
MKRAIKVLGAITIFLGMAIGSSGHANVPVLTRIDFSVLGIGLQASPDYQAVPNGIASRVNTFFVSGGEVLPEEVLRQLPQDYKVKAELTGPSFQTPMTLTTSPGSPFDLPTFPLIGKYSLNNIRLVDGSGQTLFGANPQAVTIESINDPLITSVTTRPLSLQELQDRGVTFDSSNFTAYEFTAAIATESGQVPLKFPVIIPESMKQVNVEQLPPPPNIAIAPPAFTNPPPQVEQISIEGFVLGVDGGGGEKLAAAGITLPPIPGIVAIPGNIGFLHQYFSALVMVTNGAPGMSNLMVKDLKATIIMPPGEDLTPGTDAAPGDDPIRMAKGADGYLPRQMTVMHAGPDGTSSTPDDISLLYPAETGRADFTIEGLKEGTHKLDFEITATLEGLPIGPVTLKGKASGAVLVRNPDFSVTLGHPATIRSGEAYDLFVTITNTSKSMANLVSVHLDQRALSGAVFAHNENPDKQIESILPGSSATVKYRLVAQRTGKVTATAFASEDVKGRFVLRAGVGELGIPLSPDSLIIPFTGALPEDLINSVVGLLGQAWSVATAPAGALPSMVLPISKSTVTSRANDLSEAGLRMILGAPKQTAVQDVAFDLIGADNANSGFDSLRRQSTQGLNVNRAISSIFKEEIGVKGILDFQADMADRESYRPGHISVITGDTPIRVQISDGSGKKMGGVAEGEAFREIPYGDQLILNEDAGARSTLSLLTKLESTSYRIDLVAEADASFDMGVVVPDASGTLRQVRFAGVSMSAQSRAWMTLQPGTDTQYLLRIDSNADGIEDSSISPSSVLVAPDRGPKIIAVTQISPGYGPGGDKHGRTVAVLFSERVTKDTAQNAANYAVDGNAVRISYIQQGSRMAFVLLRDGIGPFHERSMTVSGLKDLKGNGMTPYSQEIPITITAKGPGGVVAGNVRLANGTPVPGATVRLLQLVWVEEYFERVPKYFIFSEKPADNEGGFRFDYVFQNDDPAGPFIIEAVNQETNEAGQITAAVAYHGQKLNLDIFMKARGTIAGTVRDASGNPVANVPVLLTTLSDNRSYMTTADASGAFSFSNVRVGTFSLKAASQALMAEGTAMGTLPDDGGRVEQDITIYKISEVKTGNVAGKILEADGVTPRPGAVVIVRNYPTYQNWMRSGPDGGFSFTGVFAGKITVEARNDMTGEYAAVNGNLLENTTGVFNIIMKGMGNVTGNVVRNDGLSPAGLYVMVESGQVKKLTQTDANGIFKVEGMPTGDISVRVLDPYDYNKTLVSGTVSIVAAGDVANITLYINAVQKGTITGTVYKRDGSVYPNVEVRRVVDPLTFKYVPYRTDGNGVYTMPDLGLGSYMLIVVSGKEIANATASLSYSGQIRTVDLSLVGPVGTVTGTVYDEGSGMMPVGADVRLISMKPDPLGWLKYDPSYPATIKSDPQTGKYTFTGIYPGMISLSASSIFRPVPATYSGNIPTSGGTVTADLVLKDTFGSISGTVSLPDGTPAGEGVRVSVRFGGADVTVTTDSNGKFQFRPIIPAGSYEVIAEDPITTLKARVYAKVPAGADTPVAIKLLGRGTLTVRVFNSDGAREASANVEVKGSNFPNDLASGSTDQNGEITFYNLTEGAYAVSALGGFNLGGRAQGSIPADGASSSVDVMLAASGTVKGRFLKADGVTPIGGAQIKLLNSSRQVLAYTSTSTDPSTPGEFTLEHVPMGDFRIEGFDPISDRRGIGGGRMTTNGETVNVNVIVTPRGFVKGAVLNNSGTAPIEKANVSISVTGIEGWSYQTVTIPDGSFSFAGVPAGKFTLQVKDPATNLAASGSGTISYEGETATVEIRLQASGSIEGRVMMPDGVTQAYNVKITCQGVGEGQLDPQGYFRFVNLPVGKTYYVIVSELGTHRAKKESFAVNYDGEVVSKDMVLNGVGAVVGTVFDSDGTTPLPGATVRISATGLSNATSAYYTDYTSENGSYGFSDVPAGTFTVQVTHPLRTTAASSSGSITSEAQTVNLNLVLGPVGSVTGKVLLPDGVTPARGGIVKFSGCNKSYVAVIDSSGIFVLSNVPLCNNFTLSMEDSTGAAINYYRGSISTNGEEINIGTVVLDDKAISVIDIIPANGEVNVAVNSTVEITFSEPADPNTVNSSTVYVSKGSSKITGSLALSADRTKVTFKPSSPLAGFTLYTITVTTDVKDRVGRPLIQNFASTFTTVDNMPPTVTSINPANGTVQVPADSVVRIAFSESIDPNSVGGIKLTLNNLDVPARLDLAQGNTVAILTPLSPLNNNSIYTVWVYGVKDTVGNIINGISFFSFITTDTIAPTVSSITLPPGADLIKGNTVTLTASVSDTDTALVDFFMDDRLAGTDMSAPYTVNMLLSKEGRVVVKAIAQDKVGNRGIPTSLEFDVKPDQPPVVNIISPAEGSAVNAGSTFTVTVEMTDDLFAKEVTLTSSGEVSFSQTKTNSSGKNFKSSFVLTVPAGAVPNGSILLTAVGKDSAGNTVQATRELIVHDGIAPTASITSPGQTIRYRAGEAGSATVTAADNAGVSSIACSASGAATGGQEFTIDPPQKMISRTFGFQVRADAAPHAQITLSCTAKDATANQVTSSITILVADTVPPSVVWASILNNSTIPVNSPISVLFNETLAQSSVNASSVELVADDASAQIIAGTVALSSDRKVVTFAPTTQMTKGTPYKFTIKGMVTDDAGNALGSDYVLRFTTSTGIDNLQPEVVSISPASGSVNVPLNAQARVSFSKPVNPLTVTGSFYLSPAVTGSISVSGDGMTATFTPDRLLLPNTSYTVYVKTGIKDVAGNPLYQQASSSFATGETMSDGTPPFVVDVSPMSGATGVPLNGNIVVRLSEPVSAPTVNGRTVVVSASGVPLAGSLSLEQGGAVIRYKPANLVPLAANTLYEIKVTKGVTDLAGNPLQSEHTSYFTTGSGSDTTLPTVASTSPANGSQTVGLSDPVTITFTEPVSPASVISANIYLRGGGADGNIAGTLSLSGDRKVVTFIPSSPYFAGQWYYLYLSNVEDAAGNKISGTSFSFKTVTASGTDTNGLPTGATITANPATLYADGFNTTTVQITNINRSGTLVPNGTKIGVTVYPAYRVSSSGGSIIGGLPANDPRFAVFTTLGGAVTLTYKVPELKDLLPNQTAYAYIQVAQLDAANNPMGLIASGSVTLVRGSTATVATNPNNLLVGANSSAEVTIAVKDRNGNPAAAGTMIGVTAAPIYSATSLGGAIAGGTVGLDTRYQIFQTITGGLVTATYTPPSTIGQNGNAYIQVVSIDGSGQVTGLLGTGSISLSTTSGYTAPQPQVLTVSPVTGSTGVPLNARITATFSQALDPATVTSTNFSVKSGGTSVGSPALSSDGKTVTLVPTNLLAPNTSYTIYIGTGIKSSTGNPLLSYMSSSFSTGTGTDTTPLAVTGVNPADGSSGVGTNSAVSVQFNKQVNAASINSGTMTVSSGGVNIPGKIAMTSGNTMVTFTPDRSLDPQTTYTVSISTALTDIANNALASVFTSTFTTSTGIDNLQPEVVSISPASGSVNVPQNTIITVTFSEPMTPVSINPSTFYVSGPGGVVNGTITIGDGDTTATFTPAYPLFAGGNYNVTVTGGAKDIEGNPLVSSISSRFTVAYVPTSNTQPTSASVTVNPASIFADGTISTTVTVSDNVQDIVY